MLRITYVSDFIHEVDHDLQYIIKPRAIKIRCALHDLKDRKTDIFVTTQIIAYKIC